MRNASTVEVQMMIRRPVDVVFEAFIDPQITTKFWFTKSDGKLEQGKTLTWQWEMYQVSTKVLVKEIIPQKRISTLWNDPPVSVDYIFTSVDENKTLVVIRSYGFVQKGDELLQVIKDNTGGFTSVVDGLKAWLEHGIELNLVQDKFPEKLQSRPSNLGEWQAKT